MLNYKAPMNLDESAYAEKYHHLIYAFLGKHKLPMDEFYDIAVFGYLRAVRKYLARPELREQYKFSTIAYRAMSCDVHHSREYWLRAKRNRQECPLDEERHTNDLRDTVSGTVGNVIDFERVVAHADVVHQPPDHSGIGGFVVGQTLGELLERRCQLAVVLGHQLKRCQLTGKGLGGSSQRVFQLQQEGPGGAHLLHKGVALVLQDPVDLKGLVLPSRVQLFLGLPAVHLQGVCVQPDHLRLALQLLQSKKTLGNGLLLHRCCFFHENTSMVSERGCEPTFTAPWGAALRGVLKCGPFRLLLERHQAHGKTVGHQKPVYGRQPFELKVLQQFGIGVPGGRIPALRFRLRFRLILDRLIVRVHRDAAFQRHPEAADETCQQCHEDAVPLCRQIDDVPGAQMFHLAYRHRQAGRFHIGRLQAAGHRHGAGRLDLSGADPLCHQRPCGNGPRLDVHGGQVPAGQGTGVDDALAGDTAGLDALFHHQRAVVHDVPAGQRLIAQGLSLGNIEILHSRFLLV